MSNNNFNDALDVIADLIEQHCWTRNASDVDSAYNSSDAHAMRFLAEHGRFDIKFDDHGRYVAGKVKW